VCARARNAAGEWIGLEACTRCPLREAGRCKGGYLSDDGEDIYPRRHDSAFMTSEAARKAVAQRVLDTYLGEFTRGSDVHSQICYVLECGVRPEVVEDRIRECRDEKELGQALEGLAWRAKEAENYTPPTSLHLSRDRPGDKYRTEREAQAQEFMLLYS
jgi:hypothetical protein